MAFPVHEGIGTPAINGYANSITPEIPADTAEGERLLVFFSCDYTRIVSGPAEWSPTESNTYPNNVTCAVFDIVAGANEPNPTFSIDAGNEPIIAVIVRVSGHTSVIGVSTFTNNSTLSLPASGTASTDSLVYRVAAIGIGADYSLTMPGNPIFNENSGADSSSNVRLAVSNQQYAKGAAIPAVNASQNTAETAVLMSIVVSGALAARRIDDIDTNNIVETGQSSAIIAGAGLGTVSSVTLGGEACTLNGNTDIAIDIDIPLHINVPHDSNLDLIVTDETGSLTLSNVQVTANSSWAVVEITAIPDEAETDSVIEFAKSDADLSNFVAEVGDSFAYENQAGLTIDSLGVPIIEPPTTVNTSLKFFDASVGQWTNVASLTFTDSGAVDTPDSLVSIDTVTPSRTSATIEFSYPGADVTSFEYRLDSGEWLAAISPLSISGLSEETLYSLYVRPLLDGAAGGATSSTFTTLPAVDAAPDAFSFTAQTGVALNDVAVSNVITVLGVDAGVDIPVSITGGRYSVSTDGGQNWGAYTSAATNVRLNYQIRVEHDTASTFSAQASASLDVGGTLASFVSTTLADAVAPEITLTGGDQTITVGEVWTEPGYSASDNADGNLTDDVVVSGSVEDGAEGTYTLIYSVSDSAGNQTQVTRRVTVNAVVIEPDITVDFIPRLLSVDVQEVTVFKGRGNRFRVELSHDGQPIDLSLFSRFELFGLTVEPIDSNTGSVIDVGGGEGVINIDAGEAATVSGSAKTTLIGYASEYLEGVVLWHPSLAQARVTVNLIDA